MMVVATRREHMRRLRRVAMGGDGTGCTCTSHRLVFLWYFH